jgi:hypothetical protein
MNPLEPSPFLEKFTNSKGEAAMDKKIICRFHSLLAKRIRPTIRPTTLLESVGCPKALLES